MTWKRSVENRRNPWIIGAVVAGLMSAIGLIAGLLHERWALGIAVGFDVASTCAYLLLALFIAPRISIAAPLWGAKGARLAGFGFFLAGAAKRTESIVIALHSGHSPNWYVSWHGVILNTIQAGCGWAFFLLAIKFLGVLIVDRRTYESVVDERIHRTIELMKEDGAKTANLADSPA